jgi:hemerythrin-like domain-containing protein
VKQRLSLRSRNDAASPNVRLSMGGQMPIQIGQGPDHGFDQPLGLLSDCHQRIEHFLHVLVTVATEGAGGPLTASYRDALEGAIRYFTVAAPKHTADEEVSLFPRLRESADTAAPDALASLDSLEHDHDEAEGHHAAVEELTRRWVANDHLLQSEIEELRERLARLEALYRRHIAIEDQQVFPAAARVLDHAQLKQIGNEMAARRDVRGS